MTKDRVRDVGESRTILPVWTACSLREVVARMPSIWYRLPHVMEILFWQILVAWWMFQLNPFHSCVSYISSNGSFLSTWDVIPWWHDQDSQPLDCVLADSPSLPALTTVAKSKFVWGTFHDESLQNVICEVYVEVIHWWKNYYALFYGHIGKSSVAELACLFRAYAEIPP